MAFEPVYNERTKKVSEPAVVRRLKRHLAKHEGKVLKTTRHDSKWHGELGKYFVTEGGVVQAKHVDVEQWSRECGILKDNESMSTDDEE